MNLYNHLGLYRLILIIFRSYNYSGITLMVDLSLFESTRRYYKTYTGTSYLILVLRSISWSYGTYTCITELIHVIQNLYLSYGTYTGLTDLILERRYPLVR